jgi:hypothetical protein
LAEAASIVLLERSCLQRIVASVARNSANTGRQRTTAASYLSGMHEFIHASVSSLRDTSNSWGTQLDGKTVLDKPQKATNIFIK